MKIIDWKKVGNVVRFYLGGNKCKDFNGDDWDDIPYESNAGTVSQEFIKGYLDVAFPFDWIVMEPQDDWHYMGDTPYCKNDFKHKDLPFLLVIPYERWFKDDYSCSDACYCDWMAARNIYKFYLGDKVEKLYQINNKRMSKNKSTFYIFNIFNS